MAQKEGLMSPHPSDWVRGKAIGCGSFGTVHLAMSKATGALFVVKSAKTDAAASIDSLRNEANILQDLDSPYVVRCIGRDLQRAKDGGIELSIFTEYMAGGSLADIAEKFGGSLDEDIIRLFTREILHGLKYLHGNGIVHCDIKGKNVLLCSSGNIKLADFGCAKRLSSVSQATTAGTPLWMAPEVIRKEGVYTASDIWSLGCTIIEMATGRPPWLNGQSHPEATLMKIASSDEIPPFPGIFSKDGLDFLSKCLVRDPKKRASAEELLNHPFVTGSSLSRSSSRQKNGGDSPVSVLTLEHDSGDNSVIRINKQSDEHNRFRRTPFSMKHYQSAAALKANDDALRSSGVWITVRCYSDSENSIK
ncbi:hypothetical protein MLD38_023154 [Melastoma candidum]|uniref:Uncharacterized protein n=1 Tax=Melastoma candidum TaxID=119954 RepID=A0ACB9QQ31_9MYRT|nr:hypothetical protein MLD38_023154 [Melastoma candidum]